MGRASGKSRLNALNDEISRDEAFPAVTALSDFRSAAFTWGVGNEEIPPSSRCIVVRRIDCHSAGELLIARSDRQFDRTVAVRW
jgi:hypothetical protein